MRPPKFMRPSFSYLPQVEWQADPWFPARRAWDHSIRQDRGDENTEQLEGTGFSDDDEADGEEVEQSGTEVQEGEQGTRSVADAAAEGESTTRAGDRRGDGDSDSGTGDSGGARKKKHKKEKKHKVLHVLRSIDKI